MPHVAPLRCGCLCFPHSETACTVINSSCVDWSSRSFEKGDNNEHRSIPIKVAKTLITRHIEQRVVNTPDPLADFPNISEHHSPPGRNMHEYFIPKTVHSAWPGELTIPMNWKQKAGEVWADGWILIYYWLPPAGGRIRSQGNKCAVGAIKGN